MQSIALLSISADELRTMITGAVTEALESRQAPEAPHDDQDTYLTREETAKELHVSKLTLRNYEKRGILKPQRIGRRVLYSRNEISAALAAGRL